ncbi:MAG: NVEALA domain-containing protein [Bacteroidaceae bacterium]|nr:NVEALA domain-containing protein [Bacteroidaceae bacterium]
MRRNILKIAFVVAIAMVAGINVFNAQKPNVLSDVAMANVEALANDEGGKELTCYNSITSKKGCQVRYCPICDYLEDSTDCWYSLSETCTKM